MSLRRNTLANYFGQGYATMIDVIVVPLYLQFLGAEAFGLVGFLALLRVWLRMLDMGLSPTLARQVAYAKGLGNGFAGCARLLRSFEIIFLAIAAAVVVGVYGASDRIAADWLNTGAVEPATVAYCVSLMGVIVALRFFAALYGSGIRGLEDQVWINGTTAVLSTIRTVGALAILAFVSTDIRLFFEYQVLMTAVELLVLGGRLYRLFSIAPGKLPIAVDIAELRKIAPFALSIAYASGIWVVLSQSDKLILSFVLPLNEYGYFTLVGLIAGGITLLTVPISQAILPRLTALNAAGQRQEMLLLYKRATQLVAVISVSAALFTGVYADALVYAWTGDRTAARWCADVLPWFAVGNGVLNLAAYQFFLQNALGNLRLHVIGSTVSACIQVPVMYFAALHYGALGAGIAWCCIRILWFLFWIPVVHRSLVPGLHWGWLRQDVLPPAAVGVAVAIVLPRILNLDATGNRPETALVLLCVGIALLAIVALSSGFVRSTIFTSLSAASRSR